MLRISMAAAAATLIAVPALAQETDSGKTLSIGDKAPAIDIAHWLKGTPVKELEEGNVYVIEFWATWCGPCVASMPHLSELQEKYEDYDVQVIGVSDEPLPVVVDFLFKEYNDGKMHHERTNYTLTTDPDESVKNDYFKAAGQRGIPTAFIVGKDRKVEWIGHPMTIDEPLEAVVKDSWDRDEFKEKWDNQQRNERVAQKHQQAFMTAMQNEQYEKAIGALDELIALGDGFAGAKMQKMMVLAGTMGKYDRAYRLGWELVEDNWDNAQMLNQIAWYIVDDPSLEERDLRLALKAANRANELTDKKDGAILDTVARVHYEQGDVKKALEIQRRAVEMAPEQMRQQLVEWLERYEREAGR